MGGGSDGGIDQYRPKDPSQVLAGCSGMPLLVAFCLHVIPIKIKRIHFPVAIDIPPGHEMTPSIVAIPCVLCLWLDFHFYYYYY